MNLYPSILTDSIITVQQQVERVQDHPEIDVVQIDVVDGYFADNLTITPLDLAMVDFGKLKVDLHLMVDEPMDYVWELESVAKEVPIRSVIAQVEHMSYQQSFLEEVKKQDWQAGLSLNLHTPLSAIENKAWPHLDLIQIMAIEAGFQGQSFNPEALKTLKAAAEKISLEYPEIELVVDGGVKLSNAQAIAEVGTAGIAVGSELWNAADLGSTIKAFSKIN